MNLHKFDWRILIGTQTGFSLQTISDCSSETVLCGRLHRRLFVEDVPLAIIWRGWHFGESSSAQIGRWTMDCAAAFWVERKAESSAANSAANCGSNSNRVRTQSKPRPQSKNTSTLNSRPQQGRGTAGGTGSAHNLKEKRFLVRLKCKRQERNVN